MAHIQSQGALVCGVAPHDPGFSARDAKGQFQGLEADLCRAVAAALLGAGARVEFRPLETVHEFLADSSVDLVFHRLTWTLAREAPGQLEFGPVYFLEQLPGKPLEALAPLLRSDDMDFSRVVRWSIYALLDAESKGITQANAEAVGGSSQWPPSGSADSLGLAPGWARDMVVTVGNYGEIYDRHQGLGHTSPLVRGVNRLWHHGGLLFAPPLQ
jgi:hypothetical protein